MNGIQFFTEEKNYFKGWSGLVANLQGILTPAAQFEVFRVFLRSRRRLERWTNWTEFIVYYVIQ